MREYGKIPRPIGLYSAVQYEEQRIDNKSSYALQSSIEFGRWKGRYGRRDSKSEPNGKNFVAVMRNTAYISIFAYTIGRRV